MNENFKRALKFVLRWEGGYSNHKDDPGGETNKGITHFTYNLYRKHKGLQPRSVKLITDAEVEEIYFTNYYKASGADRIQSQSLALIVFDTAVNMGVTRAKTFLQQSNWNIKKYLELRREKYKEFARVNSSQKVFLKGWLNRVNDLEKYIKALVC